VKLVARFRQRLSRAAACGEARWRDNAQEPRLVVSIMHSSGEILHRRGPYGRAVAAHFRKHSDPRYVQHMQSCGRTFATGSAGARQSRILASAVVTLALGIGAGTTMLA